MRGWPIDEALLERAADSRAWHGFPHPDLGLAFSAALGPPPAHEVPAIEIEAHFRMAGAQAVAEHFTPFADVVPFVRELAALGIPRVLLSTSWSGIAERKAAAIGFDGPLLLAEDFAAEPASPQGLARVAVELRLPADRIWFVASDLRANVRPAQAAGMHAIWIDRSSGRASPGETAAGNVVPQTTIASFDELLPLLAEPYTRGLLALRYIMRSALQFRPGHSITANEPNVSDRTTTNESD